MVETEGRGIPRKLRQIMKGGRRHWGGKGVGGNGKERLVSGGKGKKEGQGL